MKHRADSGYNMNVEFGYEIANMRTQTNESNDTLSIISFTFLIATFVYNLIFLCDNEAILHTVDNAAILHTVISTIIINVLAISVCTFIVALHPKNKELDKELIVCIEILERLEKSKEFSLYLNALQRNNESQQKDASIKNLSKSNKKEF